MEKTSTSGIVEAGSAELIEIIGWRSLLGRDENFFLLHGNSDRNETAAL